LVLPQLTTNEKYKSAYKEFEDLGDYLILDNGAAEDQWYNVSELMSIARQYKVDEVAIPDTLGDADTTYLRLELFFADNEPLLQDIGINEWGPKLGFVAQGKEWHEAMRLVSRVMQSKYASRISTVYLPRLLLQKGDRYARIALANNIHNTYPELNIHMFGASVVWPLEMLAISKEAPFVRSMDTSMPFNFAIASKRLGVDYRQANPGRVQNYFDWCPNDLKFGESAALGAQSLFWYNVQVALRWAGGDE